MCKNIAIKILPIVLSLIIPINIFSQFNGGSADGYGKGESIYTRLNGESPEIMAPITSEFFLCGKGEATVTLTAGEGGNNVKWYENQFGGDHIHLGETFTTPNLESNIFYWVSTFNSTTSGESNRVRQLITVAIADAGLTRF